MPLVPAVQVELFFRGNPLIFLQFCRCVVDGELWDAHTDLSSLSTRLLFHHLLGATLNQDYAVQPFDLIPAPGTSDPANLAYSGESPEELTVFAFDADHPIVFNKCSKDDFQVWHTAPVLPNGWALLGELDKWVSVSAFRFSQLAYSEAAASVRINGPQNETVAVTWALLSTDTVSLITAACVLPPAGSATLRVPDGVCD